MQSLTADDVRQMQSNGLTREVAQGWRDFYSNEFARNANNFAARNRADLMSSILGYMD